MTKRFFVPVHFIEVINIEKVDVQLRAVKRDYRRTLADTGWSVVLIDDDTICIGFFTDNPVIAAQTAIKLDGWVYDTKTGQWFAFPIYPERFDTETDFWRKYFEVFNTIIL